MQYDQNSSMKKHLKADEEALIPIENPSPGTQESPMARVRIDSASWMKNQVKKHGFLA